MNVCIYIHIHILASVFHCFSYCHFILYLTSGSASLPTVFSKNFLAIMCIFSSRWTLESTCQVPLKIPLGFWLEVHWIYRLIWGELTSLHYWIFPSRNMVCLSISSGVLFMSFFFSFFNGTCRSYPFLVRYSPGFFLVFVIMNYIFHFTFYFLMSCCWYIGRC